MDYILLERNQTLTEDLFPLFEIIHSVEIFFILLLYCISPVAMCTLWNARPFHRNLRLSLCNLVVQALFGATGRLIAMYNNYAGEGPLAERPSMILATVLRSVMIESVIGSFFFFSLERLVATFAWSWYEKESTLTIIIFIILEGSAVLWSWTWAIAIVHGYATLEQLLTRVVISLFVGGSVAFFVVTVNYRAMRKMKIGAHINQYSVARSFQIRENVAIMKALSRIGINLIFLIIPTFLLSLSHLFLSTIMQQLISRALYDLIIAIFPPMIIFFIPLSDPVFERSLKRMAYGERIFRLLEKLRRNRIKETTISVAMNETDHYFNTLAQSLSGPHHR